MGDPKTQDLTEGLRYTDPDRSQIVDSKRRDVRVVVRLRGFAATARHLAGARVQLKRERRRMKEHAWK